jgi:hypothetical protein
MPSCGRWLLRPALQRPLGNIGVNLTAIHDPINPNLVAHDIEDHTIVAHAEFPIAVEGLSKSLAVLIGGLRQPLFNSGEDTAPDVDWDADEILRQIMVKQDREGRTVRHPLSPSLPRFEALPELPQREGLLGIEGLPASLSEEIETTILADRDRLSNEVRCLLRQ